MKRTKRRSAACELLNHCTISLVLKTFISLMWKFLLWNLPFCRDKNTGLLLLLTMNIYNKTRVTMSYPYNRKLSSLQATFLSFDNYYLLVISCYCYRINNRSLILITGNNRKTSYLSVLLASAPTKSSTNVRDQSTNHSGMLHSFLYKVHLQWMVLPKNQVSLPSWPNPLNQTFFHLVLVVKGNPLSDTILSTVYCTSHKDFRPIRTL